MTDNAAADVPSPCVQVCALDTRTRLCRGCLRHIDEIRDWSRMSAADKQAVWDRLPARRAPESGEPLSRLA